MPWRSSADCDRCHAASRSLRRARTVTLAGAIGVQRVRYENTYAEEGQQGCYELGHRRLPCVMAMPTMAAVRKWR